MPKYLPTTVIALLGISNVGLGLGFLDMSRMLSASHAREKERSALEQTVAYSCGYRAGQVGIMSRMPSLFSKGDLVVQSSCQPLREMAIKNGFTTVAADPF